jgi:PAS domain-containing protein
MMWRGCSISRLLDNNLVVTYFNPAAERLLNRKSVEVVGKHLFDAFPEIKGSSLDKKHRQAVKEKTFLSFETQFESAPYQGWYDVRVDPHKHPTATGSDATQEPTP